MKTREAPYRLLIAGSRDLLDKALVDRVLTRIWMGVGPARPLTIVQGECPTGPDAFAKAWGRRHRRFGVEVEGHEAEWHLFGPSAGPSRNRHMVSCGADEAQVFIGPCTSAKCRIKTPHGSHGATNCADLADAAGIETTRWEFWRPASEGLSL